MRATTLVIAILALALPAGALAAPAVPEGVLERAAQLRDQALEDNRAWEMLAALVNEVGPRFAGSPADEAAVAWGMRTLREAGFENVRAESVEVPRWVRGEIVVRTTAPWPQDLVAVALGGSVGTPDEGIEAPVLMLEDLDELEEIDEREVRGKIVFINRRMERRRDGSDYGPTVQMRVHGATRAARKGAVGVLIRSVGTSNERIAHTGGMRYADDAERIPAAAVSNPDADLLERQLATGRTVTLHMYSSARELPNARSANVVGEVPGRGPLADEIVILGAHLDAWDITPGAHDDAAGVAIVAEAARLIAAQRRNPPRRTLRVVLFANEEFGLSGAKQYAEAHADTLDMHAVGLGADAGSFGAWQFNSGVQESALPVIEAMAALLEPLGIEHGDNDSNGIADFKPIREDGGVPVLGIRQDMAPYFDIHHTINDTLDKVDPAELTRNVAAYVALVYVAAYTDTDFGRHPGFEPATEVPAEAPEE